MKQAQAVLVTAWMGVSFVGCSADPESSPNPASAGATAMGGSASGAGSGGVTSGGSALGGGGGALAGSGGDTLAGSGGSAGTLTGGAGAGGAASGGSAGAAALPCSGDATYSLTVDVTWSDEAVADRHYTQIIGGVHAAALTVWELGGYATPGVKGMAETGNATVLGQEVESAISAGTAKAVVKFGGGAAPGSSTTQVTLSPEFSRLSFGSMLAPTPDWFIGVSGLDLCEAGAWAVSKTVEAHVYDAGTKDGENFDYGGSYTEPPAAIAQAVKFFPEGTALPAGSITFQKM
jgi:hypothetical protein